jgi:hypothetical protein
MRITYRRRFVVGVLASLLSGLLASTASAAVPLGGGASIVVGEGYCTLTTVGHDNTGELVGFTAAHCGGLGARVRAKPSDGSVVAANGDLDYAVIKFDPAKAAPIANIAGFATLHIRSCRIRLNQSPPRGWWMPVAGSRSPPPATQTGTRRTCVTTRPSTPRLGGLR